MSYEDEMSPFEIELVAAIRRLAYGGVDGPTGIEALTMALGGEGKPGTNSIVGVLGEIAQALFQAEIPNEISISEFSSGDENYIIGLTQGLDSIASAIEHRGRDRARACVVKLIDQLGVEFKADGGLGDHDKDRLSQAMRDIDVLADIWEH